MRTVQSEGAARRIGPVDVKVANQASAVAEILTAIERGEPRIFGFCNAHTVNIARKSPAFREALASATLFNDGVGVDLASRLLYGQRFPANLNGTDFTPALLAALPQSTRIFLLGSPPGVAETAGRLLGDRHASLHIVGTRDGYFSHAEEADVAAEVRRTGAELLLIGMGHPRQEIWAARYASKTGAIILCIGAYLDFAAGRVPRAPALVRSMRMEWAYRLAVEPRRLASRYLIGNVTFLSAALAQRCRRGRTSLPRAQR